jgi:dienelactone hydrolase
MPVRTFDGTIADLRRNRTIAYRVYYPAGWRGPLPIVLFSHGGDGSTNGHTQLGHFGTEWASAGFLALHLNHLPSATISRHYSDRPADVTVMLDHLEARTLPLPTDLVGTPDVTRIAHAGHSWGAYTAHAVGGARFTHGQYRDPRVRAIIPISPQGPGGFGAYDNGPADNSWRELPVPSLVLVGADEKNGPLGDPQQLPDWRLYPYERAPAAPARFLAVLPGQDHGDMAGGQEPAQRFLRRNTRRFLQVFLQGREALVCDIGVLAPIPGNDLRRKSDPTWNAARACPPFG